jgi:arylsulfatase A-like enzyme
VNLLCRIRTAFRDAVLLVLGVGLFGCTPPGTAEPPNIIYILADDLGYGELGSYGQTKIRTPNIDRMALEGIRFTQHYSGSPVCAPSRAALLTGLHTGHGQIRDNFELGGYLDEEERGQMPLDPGTFTIGHMLQNAGYATAAIGKWGLGGPGSAGEPNEHGFDYFFGYMDQKQAHNYYPTHLWRNGEYAPLDNEYFSPHQRFEGDDPLEPDAYERYKGTDYAADIMADDALRWIREHADERFFLYFPVPIPHLGLQVPDSAVATYPTDWDPHPYPGDHGYLPHLRPNAAYAAMITQMDSYVGQILALLSELGLEDNTLVIFTSDNGTTYTGGVDAEFWNSTAGLRGLKGSVYDGGIRVPFIARWPGRIQPGTTSDQISAFWDMLPTFAEIVGTDSVPRGLDGTSILAALEGATPLESRPALYWEYHGLWNGAQAVRLGLWKGVRLGGHDDPEAAIELYDLSSDAAETTDVAADYPVVVDSIRNIMNSRTESRVDRWNFAGPGTR